MFSPFETSADQASPITLYLFRYGESIASYFAYTDSEYDVPLDLATGTGTQQAVFRAMPIMRGSVNASGSLDKAQLEVTVPKDSEVADLFRVYPPASVVTMTIYQGDRNDPDKQFLVCWTGRIVATGVEGNERKLIGEPVSTALRRPGLRRNYQYGCPLVLYGPRCRANKAAATTSTTVQGVNGTTVLLPPGWSNRAAKHAGGLLEWTNAAGDKEVRTILKVTNTTQLLLGGLPKGLSGGMSVSVVLGCDHTTTDCRDVHNNILNYGGQPWIPLNNPVGLTSIYY